MKGNRYTIPVVIGIAIIAEFLDGEAIEHPEAYTPWVL